MSHLDELEYTWDYFAKTNPFGAILTGEHDEEFFQSGINEVNSVMGYIDSLSLSKKLSMRTALDFGCGVGRLTQPLSRYFHEVYGVDIAPKYISLAEEYNKYPNKCKYYLNKKDDLEIFENNSFDLIYSNIVLQHMKPKYSKKYITEFLRVLAPGGLLIFQLSSEIITLWGKMAWKILIPLRSSLMRRPFIDMNYIPKEEVTDFLEKNEAAIIDVVQDDWAGKHFKSFRYCVTKKINSCCHENT